MCLNHFRSLEILVPSNLKVSMVGMVLLRFVRGRSGDGSLLNSTSISTVLSGFNCRKFYLHLRTSCSTSCRYADMWPPAINPITVVSSAYFQSVSEVLSVVQSLVLRENCSGESTQLKGERYLLYLYRKWCFPASPAASCLSSCCMIYTKGVITCSI